MAHDVTEEITGKSVLIIGGLAVAVYLMWLAFLDEKRWNCVMKAWGNGFDCLFGLGGAAGGAAGGDALSRATARIDGITAKFGERYSLRENVAAKYGVDAP